jgi:probable phosphoglycerate mutase
MSASGPPTELILVRHGETQWNSEHRIQGHADSPLTARGQEQVAALAGSLTGLSVAAVFSSDLLRARETARILGARLGLEVRIDARLRERHLGVLEGRTMKEVELTDPALFRRWQEADPDWLVPGGESLRQRHDRIVTALAHAADSHVGQCVLLVTHGGGLDSAFRWAVDLPLTTPRRWAIPNAGLNVLRLRRGRWLIQSWGVTSHLGSADGGGAHEG